MNMHLYTHRKLTIADDEKQLLGASKRRVLLNFVSAAPIGNNLQSRCSVTNKTGIPPKLGIENS